MEQFKIREEYTEKIREYDRYILSKKKQGIGDPILSTYIIENKLMKNKCRNCNCEPIWREKPLTLILDRVDNRLDNNTLENLRFLCPNCYSQIRKKNTLLEKITKKAMNRCIDCNKLLRSRNTSCQIENDTDKKRGKKLYTQTFRCKACLEKLVSGGQLITEEEKETEIKLI